MKKEYAAIARGIPGFDSDWIETHVRVDPRIRERMQVCEPGGNSRSARTFYEVAERFLPKDDRGTGYTLFRLFPHTGRTHQLRIHLRYLGHPIVADNPYGGGRALTDDEARGATTPGGLTLIRRQALHARRLEFDHPHSGERVAYEAPLPTDMSRVLDALRDGR